MNILLWPHPAKRQIKPYLHGFPAPAVGGAVGRSDLLLVPLGQGPPAHAGAQDQARRGRVALLARPVQGGGAQKGILQM